MFLKWLQNMTLVKLCYDKLDHGPAHILKYNYNDCFRVETGQKLISRQGWSIVGNRIVANSCSASIFNAVEEIMPRVLLSNLEKVTRMTCFGEVFYSADYDKLKTCGCCVEYGNDGLFGLVQYFLYSPSLGNAVAVIHPLKQLDSVFQTLCLDNNCSHHIQEVVKANR